MGKLSEKILVRVAALLRKLSEKTLVRVATLLIVATAVTVPFWMDAPKRLPGVALGSEALLHVERALALLLALLLVLVVLVRGWQGQLPKALSGRGIEWPAAEVASATKDATTAFEQGSRALQTQIDALQEQIDLLESRFAALEETLLSLFRKP